MTFLSTAKTTFDRLIATNDTRSGVAITYHVAGGSDLARFASFMEDVDPFEDNTDGAPRSNVHAGSMQLSKDATLGVAVPIEADQVTVEGFKWNIESIADKRSYWELRLHRRADIDFSPIKIVKDR